MNTIRNMQVEQAIRKICHFSCQDCLTVFPLEEDIYLSFGFRLTCPVCSQPISVRKIPSQTGTEIFELYGCDYVGHSVNEEQKAKLVSSGFKSSGQLKIEVSNWIENTVAQMGMEPSQEQTLILHKDDVEEEESFVQDLQNSWSVSKPSQELITFDTFTKIRQAIVAGSINRGDMIVTQDGQKIPVENYPGTADLFGNNENTEAAKSRSQATSSTYHASVLQFKQKEKRKKIFQWALVVFLAMILGASPFLYKYFFVYQAQRILNAIASSRQLNINVQNTLNQSLITIWQEDGQFLTKAKVDCEKILSVEKTNAQAISCLTQALTELAHQQGSKKIRQDARALVHYLEQKHPEEANLAKARFLAKFGNLQKAKALIQDQSDLGSKILLSNIHILNQKNDLATLTLTDIHQSDPKNTWALKKLVSLLEGQSKLKEAASYQEKLVLLDLGNKINIQKLIDLYRKANEKDSLRIFLANLIMQGRSTEDLDYLYVETLFSLGQKTDVILQVDRFIQKHPQTKYLNEVVAYQQNARLEGEAPSNEQINQGEVLSDPNAPSDFIPSSRRRRGSKSN